MECRSQFTFYKSFADALKRIRKKADRADAYDAICNYALYGIEPDMDKLPDAAAIAFDLIRPNLDASKRKAESGKRGGSAKQTPSKPQANRKQTPSEKEKEIEEEKEVEIENECCYPLPPTADPALATVFSAYMDRINPAVSETVRAELGHYVRAVGKDVILWAFDTALDAKKAHWPYIRGILRDKEKRGVRCLADLQAQERQRETEKADHGQRKSFSQLVAEAEKGGTL